ncbi:MAG: polysaccharide deacetylase family protein [Desulfobacterales bacterium]|nr:polysaccharide deacetylase family protein [Desulfobacterales bacterium]
MTPELGHFRKRAALVSIHDVMPKNLPQVLAILRFLEARAVFPVTLLVVPGCQWSKNDINQLKSLQASGYELAGHGWQHRAKRIASAWHRLHGMVISRNEAEHLSLSEDEIIHIITDSYSWFRQNSLAAPILYVPPAWAMGRIGKKKLKTLPFRLYETQAGVYNAAADRMLYLPVTGYMADTRFRVKAIRTTNLINQYVFRGPLRIAIHPQDLNLGLVRDLKNHLARFQIFLSYTPLSG